MRLYHSTEVDEDWTPPFTPRKTKTTLDKPFTYTLGCGAAFTRKSSMKSHVQKKICQNEQKRKSAQKEPADQKVPCAICLKNLCDPTREDCMIHAGTCIAKRGRHECENCLATVLKTSGEQNSARVRTKLAKQRNVAMDLRMRKQYRQWCQRMLKEFEKTRNRPKHKRKRQILFQDGVPANWGKIYIAPIPPVMPEHRCDRPAFVLQPIEAGSDILQAHRLDMAYVYSTSTSSTCTTRQITMDLAELFDPVSQHYILPFGIKPKYVRFIHTNTRAALDMEIYKKPTSWPYKRIEMSPEAQAEYESAKSTLSSSGPVEETTTQKALSSVAVVQPAEAEVREAKIAIAKVANGLDELGKKKRQREPDSVLMPPPPQSKKRKTRSTTGKSVRKRQMVPKAKAKAKIKSAGKKVQFRGRQIDPGGGYLRAPNFFFGGCWGPQKKNIERQLWR